MGTILSTESVAYVYDCIREIVQQHISITPNTAEMLRNIKRELDAHFRPQKTTIPQFEDTSKPTVTLRSNNHKIYIRENQFNEVERGNKRFEIFPRREDFWVGDSLTVVEIEDGDSPRNSPTGREIVGLVVTYVGLQSRGGARPGYVAVGFNTTETTLGADWQ